MRVDASQNAGSAPNQRAGRRLVSNRRTLSGVAPPSLHTASDGARRVTGGIGRGWWAWLAPIWTLLASVGTSLEPVMGPTSDSVFRDASREHQNRCAMCERGGLIFDC